MLWPHSLRVKAGSNGHLTQHDMEAADKHWHDALPPSHAMLQAETNTDLRDLNDQMENMTWQLWNIYFIA